MGRILARYHELEHGKDAASQLRERGLAPKDVQVVVMTHLHGDHASAISTFPDSTSSYPPPSGRSRRSPPRS